MIYKDELLKKKKKIKRSIEKAEEHLKTVKVSHSDFMDEYKALNLLRLDLKTVQSRIDNYGAEHPSFDTYHLPTNKQ